MPQFSKFVIGQRNSVQLLDTEGYVYVRKKCRDTSTHSTWRCAKNGAPTRCPSHCYLREDQSLLLGRKPHNHQSNPKEIEKREVLHSLKMIAREKPTVSTQSLVADVLSNNRADIIVHLPKMESLARSVQRSRTHGLHHHLLPSRQEQNSVVNR